MGQSVDPHFDKAEAYINLEKYAEGMCWDCSFKNICRLSCVYLAIILLYIAEAEYHKIIEMEPNNRQAQEGVQTVQRLIKKGKQRDYYKILGLRRTATSKEIKRAYREIAGKNHPDRFSDPEEKKAAEKRFIDINDARDVLMDKGK